MRLFINLTPFAPLSFNGEGEIMYEGASPLQSTLIHGLGDRVAFKLNLPFISEYEGREEGVDSQLLQSPFDGRWIGD